MPQSDILKAFLAGTPSKLMRSAAARGVLPLPADEMLQLLVHLLSDPESDVASQADATLQGWTEDDVLAQLKSASCAPQVLDHFAGRSTSTRILEAIILNASTDAPTIANLATRAPAPLLEIILYNRVRLLETPEILATIKQNPNVTQGVRAQVQDIEAQFFSDKKSAYQLDEPVAEELTEQVEPVFESELPEEDLSLEGLPLDPDAREGAILERLSKMPVPKKIQAAMVGTQEVRAILIRDTNRQVSRSVLKSPKLTEKEVESFAAMRSISDDLLREIGSNRVWSKNYVVKQNLVRNPKTPPMISQRLIPHLLSKDLMMLSKDRTVSENIRRTAQRLLAQRTTPR